MIYEMLTGKFPFKKNKETKRFINQKVNFDLKFPLSNDAKDLIEKLLNYDVDKRLIDPIQIMNHKFFSGIDWDDIYNKKIIPDSGYSSNLSSNKSIEENLTENFDKKFIENKSEVEKVFEINKKDNNYLEEISFQNFSFCDKEQILA